MATITIRFKDGDEKGWTLHRTRPAPSAELQRPPDFERADRIGEFWVYPESRAFAELLIDREEDRTLRAVLVGMLRVADRNSLPMMK